MLGFRSVLTPISSTVGVPRKSSLFFSRAGGTHRSEVHETPKRWIYCLRGRTATDMISASKSLTSPGMWNLPFILIREKRWEYPALTPGPSARSMGNWANTGMESRKNNNNEYVSFMVTEPDWIHSLKKCCNMHGLI